MEAAVLYCYEKREVAGYTEQTKGCKGYKAITPFVKD